MDLNMDIVYQSEKISAADFVDILKRSTLAERRPVDQPEVIQGMVENASVTITARRNGQIVGIARSISDSAYCTYLSDLAVDEQYQRQGIGKRLIEETHKAAGLHTMLILLAAPMARDYYPKIGMQPHHSCWVFPKHPRS